MCGRKCLWRTKGVGAGVDAVGSQITVEIWPPWKDRGKKAGSYRKSLWRQCSKVNGKAPYQTLLELSCIREKWHSSSGHIVFSDELGAARGKPGLSMNADPVYKMQQLTMVSQLHSLWQVLWRGDLSGIPARLLWSTPVCFSDWLSHYAWGAALSWFLRASLPVRRLPRGRLVGETILLSAVASLRTVTGWYSLSYSSTVFFKFFSFSAITSVSPGGSPSGVTQTFTPEEPDSLAINIFSGHHCNLCPFMVIICWGDKRGTQMITLWKHSLTSFFF